MTKRRNPYRRRPQKPVLEWTPADLAAKSPTAEDLERLKVDDLIDASQVEDEGEDGTR